MWTKAGGFVFKENDRFTATVQINLCQPTQLEDFAGAKLHFNNKIHFDRKITTQHVYEETITEVITPTAQFIFCIAEINNVWQL